jgi:hypothetical protein
MRHYDIDGTYIFFWHLTPAIHQNAEAVKVHDVSVNTDDRPFALKYFYPGGFCIDVYRGSFIADPIVVVTATDDGGGGEGEEPLGYGPRLVVHSRTREGILQVPGDDEQVVVNAVACDPVEPIVVKVEISDVEDFHRL